MKRSLQKRDNELVRVRLVLEISIPILERIEHLKSQLGLRSRGEVVRILLEELLGDDGLEIEQTHS
jgi:hypothetical protein